MNQRIYKIMKNLSKDHQNMIFIAFFTLLFMFISKIVVSMVLNS